MSGFSYFIVTRELFESAIWRDNPHALKLFLYLIGKARHRRTPKKFPGFEVKRGELVTSLSKIADENEFLERRKVKKWSRARVSRLLHYLASEKYIDILADTYGTHIKVRNYSKYQNPRRYLANTSETQANTSETVARTYNKDNNVKNEKNDNNKSENFVPPSGSKLKSNGHEWIEAESWDLFVKFRVEMKKPITETAVGFLLDVLKQNKGDQKQIIANSIAGGYPALYPLKKKSGANGWDDLRKEFCETTEGY